MASRSFLSQIGVVIMTTVMSIGAIDLLL